MPAHIPCAALDTPITLKARSPAGLTSTIASTPVTNNTFIAIEGGNMATNPKLCNTIF